MLRTSLLAIVTFLSLSSHAQSWCTPGAEWLFNFSSQQATGVRRAWYSGDTVVGGLPCQRIDQVVLAYEPVFPFGTPFSFEDSPIITNGQGDLVQLWDQVSQTFDTLAWFGASPGDQWDVPHYPAPGHFVVLDTGTSVVAGVPLRYLVVEEPFVMGVVDTLRERIGFDYYYLRPAESLAVDYTTTGLVCYKDDSLGQVDGGYLWHPCDFTLSVEEEGTLQAKLFPNPGSDHITLTLPPGPHTITLFDATGRMVHEQRTTEERPMISTEHLPIGLYRVKVRDDHGTVMGVTWVKER